MFAGEFKAKSVILQPWTGCHTHADEVQKLLLEGWNIERGQQMSCRAITWNGLASVT